MQITLGPLLYFWPKEQVKAFYKEACDWPVDRVYLGETVCSKRRQLNLDDWLAIGEQLQNAGKTVVLSTLALLEAGSDLAMVKKICRNGRFTVEANDMAAVQVLSEQGLPFTTGPLFNIYNAHTLRELVNSGLDRWTLPLELSRDDLQAILQQAEELGICDRFTTEVFAWGLMPLAVSARCFTARAHNRPKDNCQFLCLQYPEGMPVQTQEGNHKSNQIFNLNGIQTLSGRCADLLDAHVDMSAACVDAMRISPQPDGTGEVVEYLRRQLDGADIEREQSLNHQAGLCDGYWLGQAGMVSGNSVLIPMQQV